MEAIYKAVNDLSYLTGREKVKSRKQAVARCKELAAIYREAVGCYLQDGGGLIGEGTLYVGSEAGL